MAQMPLKIDLRGKPRDESIPNFLSPPRASRLRKLIDRSRADYLAASSSYTIWASRVHPIPTYRSDSYQNFRSSKLVINKVTNLIWSSYNEKKR